MIVTPTKIAELKAPPRSWLLVEDPVAKLASHEVEASAVSSPDEDEDESVPFEDESVEDFRLQHH